MIEVYNKNLPTGELILDTAKWYTKDKNKRSVIVERMRTSTMLL